MPPEATPPFYQPQQPAQQVPQQTVQNIRIEPIYVTEKKKLNGFWRNICIFLLMICWFALLLQANNILTLNINWFDLTLAIPFIILVSCIILWRYKSFLYKLLWVIFTLLIIIGIGGLAVYHSLLPGSKVSYEDQLLYDASSAMAYTLYFDALAWDYSFQERDNTTRLFEGLYTSDRRLFVSSWVENTLPVLRFTEDKNRNVLQKFRSWLTGFLSNAYVYNLYFKQLWWDTKIDLSHVQFDLVKLHAGRGKADITIGTSLRDTSALEIQWAIMPNITIHVPKDVWVDLYYKQLVGSLKLTWMKEAWSRHYQTDGYEFKEKKIKITVNVGYGNLKLDMGK